MSSRAKRKRRRMHEAARRIEAAARDVPETIALGGEVTLLEAAERDAGGDERPPRLHIVAYNGGEIEPDAWPAPVVIHLSGLAFARGKPLPVLADHDRQRPIGHAAPQVRGGRLEADGLVSMPRTSPLVRDFLTSSGQGFPWQVSIGARPRSVAYHEEGSTFEANGQVWTAGRRGLYEVQEAVLREISILTIGADGETEVTVAARAADTHTEEKPMTFDQWLKAQGKDPSAISDEERTQLKARFDAEQPAAPANPPATPQPAAPQPAAPSEVKAGGAENTPAPDDVRAQAVAQERRRVADIEAACKDLPADMVGDLKAKAVAGEVSVDALRQGLLDRVRAGRSEVPSVIVARGPQDARTLEAALCLGHAVGTEKDLLAAYGEETLNTADRFRRQGLRRTIELAAGLEGVELPMDVDARWIRAAFSTAAVPGIVGNVANKALAQAFGAKASVATRIAARRSHQNFHTHTVYSLAMSGDLEEVGPTGELKHLNLSEENWTRQVKTRGAVLSISRTDIVNDELGAFIENGQRLGKKAFKVRERSVFLLLNATGAGASFFTAARSNYAEGTATALSLAGLSTAVQMFRDQTDPSGDPAAIEPAILLVPTALEEMGKALMDPGARLLAVALGSTSSKLKEPDANVWAGNFEPMVSEWLGRTIGETAGSQKAWYLLGDPADAPAIELAYLNGQEQPTVEFFGLDQDVSTLGVSWRVFYDFGASLGEFRAGVKMKGEA